MERITRDELGVTVTDIVNLYKADEANQDLLRRASELPALPPFWRDYFRERLQLQLIDHVIIGSPTPGRESYFSFKETASLHDAFLKFPNPPYLFVSRTRMRTISKSITHRYQSVTGESATFHEISTICTP